MRRAGPSLFLLLSLLMVLSSCRTTSAVAPPPRERPQESVCTLGNDPSAHVGILPPRLGAAATIEPGVRPLTIDITGDGTAEMAFVARTARDRWLVLVGCQDFAAVVLGAFKMAGLVGTIQIEPFVASRAPAREIKVTLTARDAVSQQEFWAYFGFDGADLGQEFGWFVSRIPPMGDATRAAIAFRDEDGDGTNEIRVIEETLEGDAARARITNASAPLPRLRSVSTKRFRFESRERKFLPVD